MNSDSSNSLVLPVSFRQLLVGAAIAVCFTTTLALVAQETPAPVPPPAQVSPAADPAAEPPLRRLDDVAAPAAPATPEVAPEVAPEAPKAPTKKKSNRRRAEAGGAVEAPFGDHTVNAGREISEAVSIFGSTRVEGKVRSDAVSILGSTSVGPEGEVGGAAVAVLGKLDVQGKVAEEAVSVLGGVTRPHELGQ